jgi:hypothetical protein
MDGSKLHTLTQSRATRTVNFQVSKVNELELSSPSRRGGIMPVLIMIAATVRRRLGIRSSTRGRFQVTATVTVIVAVNRR